ncbi:VWA domain-containing protein [Sulfurimonas sp. C5]|uniref:VWA domain-containing protein n=1 Tax=Sulfurimonas sp. C5 TaxID=3036947 RepID=UPI0024585C42|nr:VWA domain-containing protein [Sulfurimonas sp. C5]MDH4945369.1 VWA domain-containing protein [Sulfurimonas sp. C5]
MTFLHPEFLYYMLPPVFVLFVLLLTQKESQAHFFAEEVMKKLRVSANTLTLRARNGLFFLMAVLMVVALAGPVIKDGEIEIQAKSADIILSLDISDSMLAEDLYPNRLKLAKHKALEVLKMAPNERVSVIAYAKNSYLVSPLSFDHSAVAFLLDKLDTDSITEKGTDILSMLEVVKNNIKSDKKKYLLVFSDGGDKEDFSKEIAFAKENNIVVFVIGIATSQGAPIKEENGEFIKQNGKIVISKLNEQISELAVKTGGVYIQGVNSNQDIQTMLNEIESIAKKKELKSKKIEKYIPLFYYPLGLAMIIFLIATSSMSKRKSVEVPASILLLVSLFFGTNAKAGVLDFMDLNDAKNAYEKKEYTKAQELYKNYAVQHKNDAGYYNSGNAFYKQKEYKKAIEQYNKAHFTDKDSQANKYANVGNSYAKIGDEKSLLSAIDAYENSLKIKDDKEVRENLEAVRKALEKKKQQQEQKKQNKKQDKNNQNDQNKQKNEQKNKQDQKNQDKQDQQNNKGNEQSENKEQKKDQQDKKQDQKKEEQNKNDQKSKQDSPQKKNEEKEDKLESQNSTAQAQHQNVMSDAEEKKWLKALNKQQKTFLYQLNQNQKVQRNEDEKPW